MSPSNRPHRTLLRVEQLEDRTTPASALRINVVTDPGAESEPVAAALAAAPFADGVDYLGLGIYRVSLAPGTTAADAVAYYDAQPGVVTAAPDSPVRIAAVPNDTSYSSLYGLPQVGAPAAWDVAGGARNFAVAVIDTGVDASHPDLSANIWTNPGEIPGNGIDDDGNGYADDVHGWDFVNDDNNPYDDNGHGTHVAGTIGAVGNNGLGVVGVNWSVGILPLKFIDAGGRGETSNAIAALNYAVEMGVRVSNNSWEVPADPALAAAIGRARLAGHVFVTVAGNGGADGLGDDIDADPAYPASYGASYNNVVTVTATDDGDRLAYFADYGLNTVTLAAPGEGILSTSPGGMYITRSGTSMAAPFVTGAVALLWSQHPDWNYLQVVDELKTSVDPLPALTGKVQTGGRLNVGRMLEGTAPRPESAPGPVVTGAAFSGSEVGSLDRVRFTFERAVNPPTFTAADVVSFTGPLGPIAGVTVAVVPGSGNREFDVTFTPQADGGTYRMTVGPDVRDALGNPMNQNGDTLAGRVAGDRFTAVGTLVKPAGGTFTSAAPPQPIDNTRAATSAVTVAEPIRISDVNMRVALTHTYLGDLVIRLFAPDGTAVTLFQNRGVNGNDLLNTLFDDEVATSIADPGARAPFEGSYRPEQPLSAFDGTLAAGTWTLEVTDMGGQDSGSLQGWALTIAGTLG